MTIELDQLAALRSAVRPPSDEARLAAADALATAIASERGGRGPARTPRRAHRRLRIRGRRLPIAAAALAAAALAIVVDGTLQPGTPGAPDPAAAAVLTRLAHVAAAQPAVDAPGPGQYLYVRSQDAYADDTVTAGGRYYSVLVPHTREIWLGADGSGWLRETDGTPVFLTPADRAAWVAAGSPALPSGGDNTQFGAGCLSIGPIDMSSLPTDPAALGAMLSARRIEGGPPGPAEDFVQVGDLLRETDASPALRAAIYQVASKIPGVVALGTVADHEGRSGVGLAYDSHGVQSALIFDPATSALLGETDTAIGAGRERPCGNRARLGRLRRQQDRRLAPRRAAERARRSRHAGADRQQRRPGDRRLQVDRRLTPAPSPPGARDYASAARGLVSGVRIRSSCARRCSCSPAPAVARRGDRGPRRPRTRASVVAISNSMPLRLAEVHREEVVTVVDRRHLHARLGDSRAASSTWSSSRECPGDVVHRSGALPVCRRSVARRKPSAQLRVSPSRR